MGTTNIDDQLTKMDKRFEQVEKKITRLTIALFSFGGVISLLILLNIIFTVTRVRFQLF